MPSVFITAANRFGYAVGSTQNVSDATAGELIAVGAADLTDTVQLPTKAPSWFADFIGTIQTWVAGAYCSLTGAQTVSGAKTFSALATFAAAKLTGALQATFVDSSGTPGNVTNSNPRGRVAVAAGASSVTVTNTLVTASSMVVVQVSSVDATLTTILQAVPAAGSFTIYGNAAATAATKVDFFVIN